MNKLEGRVYPASLVVGYWSGKVVSRADFTVRFKQPLSWWQAFQRCRAVYPRAALHPINELCKLPADARQWTEDVP